VFAIHSWYLCSVVTCFMHCCVCLQGFMLKNGTLCIFQFYRVLTDIYYPRNYVVSGLCIIYCSQNKITYQKQKLDVLPSSYLLRYNFKVICTVKWHWDGHFSECISFSLPFFINMPVLHIHILSEAGTKHH